jgi:uncharacterized protein DUF4136
MFNLQKSIRLTTMKTFNRIPVILFSLLLAGCSIIKYSSEFSNKLLMNMDDYKSFAWADNKSATNIDTDNEMVDIYKLDETIKQSVNNEMKALGLKSVREFNADLVLIYYIIVKTDFETTTAFPYYYGYNWAYRGIYISSTTVHEKKKGTLIVELYDPMKQKSVWKGWATGKVKNGKISEERLKVVIEGIFNKLKSDIGTSGTSK